MTNNAGFCDFSFWWWSVWIVKKHIFYLCHCFQEDEENPSLLFGSPVPRGLILPGTSEELPVLLLAKAVGRLHHTLRIAVFGSLQPPLVSGSNSGRESLMSYRLNTVICLLCVVFQEVVLSCIGQGPVVHVENTQLFFGKIPVLTDVTRTVQLLNQSPIPAHFTARTVQTPTHTHRLSYPNVMQAYA